MTRPGPRVVVAQCPEHRERSLRALGQEADSATVQDEHEGLEVADFDHPDSIVQLGDPPYRIDILTSFDGVDFDDAWSRRLSVDAGGVALVVIGRDDLLRNKIAAGRPQDRADVERLTRKDRDD